MQVDLVLRPHLPLLKALYSRYRLKPQGGGLRAKVSGRLVAPSAAVASCKRPCLQCSQPSAPLKLPSTSPACMQVLKVDGWQALMGDAHLVDGAFTLSDAMLAFLWSRMHVADEVKDYAR